MQIAPFPYSNNEICAPWSEDEEEVEGMDILDMAPYPQSRMSGKVHMLRLTHSCDSSDELVFNHWQPENARY